MFTKSLTNLVLKPKQNNKTKQNFLDILFIEHVVKAAGWKNKDSLVRHSK